MLVKKILVKQFFGQKNLVKKICSKKNFAQKYVKNVKKIFRSKKICSQKKIWSKKFEAKKKVWSKNIFSQNTKV